MSDWQVGDLAVCVDDTPCARREIAGMAYPVRRGAVARVDEISRTNRGNVALVLRGYDHTLNGRIVSVGFRSNRFRKIDKHEPCEEEFVTLLKRSKAPVRAA